MGAILAAILRLVPDLWCGAVANVANDFFGELSALSTSTVGRAGCDGRAKDAISEHSRIGFGRERGSGKVAYPTLWIINA